jgi:hypothetical protein
MTMAHNTRTAFCLLPAAVSQSGFMHTLALTDAIMCPIDFRLYSQ